jgi:uncharacterized protein YgbK (DUF1537 family)
MMVASLLEREGIRCPLVTSPEALAGLAGMEAVVLARKIRLIPSDDARQEAKAAAEAFSAAGARRIYYKYCATFDSTPEGNIGPIAEALLERTGAERTIFCPAFPEYTVTVFQGRMFLGPTPLGESFKQHDPVTPMCNSNLVEVLQAQTRKKVGLLPHGALIGGETASRAVLEAQGASFFVVDAVDDADVTRIAELTTGWSVTTGADALPMFLPRTWRDTAIEPPRETKLPPALGFEAVIAGSCAGPTLAQLERFEARHPVFRIDLPAVADDPELVAKISGWAAPRLAEGPVAVTTSADVSGVQRAQQALGRDGAAAMADRLLGSVARALHGLGVRRFVVAGGETSGQVFNALQLARVEVSSFDELGGGYCHAPGTDPVSLVLKAGALGGPEFFFTAFERMRRDASD